MLKNLIASVLPFVFLMITVQALALSAEGLGIWDSWTINICWENPLSFDEECGWARSVVTDTWEEHSDLKFNGWNKCNNDSQGIRILITDEIPRTKSPPGKYLNAEPNGMVLNFKFENWSDECAKNATMRKSCIEKSAVHEFGHALGFTHEQNQRETIGYEECLIDDSDKEKDCNKVKDCIEVKTCTNDTNKCCYEVVRCEDGSPARKSGAIGIPITPFDEVSVMNYCENNDWSGQLSKWDLYGLTLIYTNKASIDDRIKAVEAIIETNDPNIVASYLYAAAASGNLETVETFLEFGVNPNIQTSDGQVALVPASQKGHHEIIKELLEYGADPNAQSNYGRTALTVYVLNDNARIYVVEEFLKKGANPNILGNDNLSALQRVIHRRNDIVRKLISYGADPDAIVYSDNTSILMYAAIWGEYNFAKELLAYGANPNFQESEGKTALVLAASYHHNDIIKELVKNGADPNTIVYSGTTILAYAILEEDLDLIEELLKEGADPNIYDPNVRSSDGWPPLVRAAYQGRYDIVKILLRNDANPNIDNQAALIYAARKGYYKIVEELLKNGADINDEVWMYAITKKQYDVITVLEEHKKYDGNKIALVRAAQYYNNSKSKGRFRQEMFDIIKELLKRGYNPDVIVSKNYCTLLDNAVKNTDVALVRELLVHGANPNIQNRNGRTALIYAAYRGHTGIIKMLLENGANPHIEFQTGPNAFSTALTVAKMNNASDIVKLLEDWIDNPQRTYVRGICIEARL